MSPQTRRIWGIVLIVFFVLMIGAIGFSEWWAYNVNVPAYERAKASAHP